MRLLLAKLTTLAFVATAFAAPKKSCGAPPKSSSPIVDLGYAVHQATSNDTAEYGYYNFSNIRFGEIPERFAKAVAPTNISRAINNGTDVRICPQAYPWWIVEEYAAAYGVAPQTLSYVFAGAANQNEDCLFLDVFAPKSVFDGAKKRGNPKGKGAAVLVWIFGGGYTIGSKSASGDPAGIIARSLDHGDEGVIFVQLNYRLGLFGWLAAGEDVTPNLGLHDQRLALKWIQKHIHLFGGDPDRVTLIGESAGGGSIIHQITAYGGSKRVPFSQAISQSGAWSIAPNNQGGYDDALTAASSLTGQKVTTTAQLRSLDTKTLMAVNRAVVNTSFFGGFTYGPAVDGTFVPDFPGVLLAQGKFDHSVKVMAGHNYNETANFVPIITTTAQISSQLHDAFYNVSQSTFDYWLNTLYPDDLSGAQPYKTENDRAKLLVAEADFTCNARYLGTAFGNNTYNYFFTYPPGFHAQDTPYTFFNGDLTTLDDGSPVNATLAYAMQDYFTQFAMKGNPNQQQLPQWPLYGSDATLLVFGKSGISYAADGLKNPRCEYWQSGVWRN